MNDLVFIASKLAHVLVEPDSLLVLALALGATSLWRWPRFGRWLVSVSAAVLVVGSFLPVGIWLLAPLENRFSRPGPETLAEVEGIIVLGGAAQPDIAEARQALALNRHAERIAEMAMLARRFPDIPIIVAAGSGDVRGERATEAAAIAPYLDALGIAPSRVTLEPVSRNTYENAVESRLRIRPESGARWLLVTSAFHMPRAMGVFRAAGWDPVAYPVDYLVSGRERWPVLAPAAHWRDLRLAAHEYAGLLGYYLAGYSNTLFPDPRKD